MTDEKLAEERLGTQIGAWRLERVLGIGSMASVFVGRRPEGQVAAVKVLHARYNDEPSIRKRFLREGPIGSALAAVGPLCEGFAQVYESAHTEDGTAYLAMELLVGENVFDRLVRLGPLPREEVLWIAQKVLEVLMVAHPYGIVHRDLKPENLNVAPDARVKVLDFGVARVSEALPEHVGELPEHEATRTGVAIGSCEYMPPEQAKGSLGEIDGRTDLFGLGATMYTLLTGHIIHGPIKGARLMIAAATQQAIPITSVAPAVDPALGAVVMRALAFTKTERYPDAATMRADVVALRSNREPPYVAAVARGVIRPGDPLLRR